MIPKISHLCWLSGDPYPEKIQYCIDSWKKVLPDYEVMLWDTSRFDVNSIPWTKQAFEAKKYAFVADYIRLYAVYNYGGIYLDSDVEAIRPFDDLLDLPYFVGAEAGLGGIELAAFGAEKGLEWVEYAMHYYEGRNFIKEDGEMDIEPMPRVLRTFFEQNYSIVHIDRKSEFDPDPSKLCVFPMDWFNAHPMDENEKLHYHVTRNTRCIHHFANAWTSDVYVGGPLHKLYYWITGINWKFDDRRFKLYGKQKKNKEI